MNLSATLGLQTFRFGSLREVMAKATPLRSGDCLAGLAAATEQERVAARWVLADVPLQRFLDEALIPYETDEVTRLIIDGHDRAAFAPVSGLTVGGLRDWLLSDRATPEALARLAPGLTPEMVAAVSKIMRNQDLMLVARKCEVVTRFRNTVGLRGHLSVRLQPNHPTDDPAGIVASLIDGLLHGAGDAVIGINPVSDSVPDLVRLNQVLAEVIERGAVPTQSCVLTHVTNTLQAIALGAPVDLVFQSIAGTEVANRSFGIDLALLDEAHAAALALQRGTVGDNVMYFETGQGSALSANAHHGVDQQTCEARAYAVARRYRPMLVNTVVGFIGPEYLYDGKQIIRAGLEDHFCGKLLGLPMGCDICYTNHAEADQDDMDNLMVLLASAGLNFLIGVPGADDVMLNYQSTSFHDALVLRDLLGLKRAPEFEAWLQRMGVTGADGRLLPAAAQTALAQRLWALPEPA
ncbi:MAG: ethanolamine ammonia-lyase subunit EutB [Hydrogenophaga sp.]|nr:ethanolamine ammonia-lyase subunit EutB [Gammaproteobacteria bacterium]MDZ4292486.1 ethanolamine ammonia-lyase subunit EutB [Hydrogenophaga sp.]PKO76652.1 MAG: ethanolamine ammonia lyase large subunit [Betaproteobacteria bacterium HGW-Betaproteobacteria-15]MBU4279625.1 ethanolamine ammonia-lyase subunit EutB [Gammaproteobacteria bacterium]MBU4324122.1 ethanolamine ammonia-lyase subunit EutB [Gammaproteobacteria bacterium]